MANHRKVEPIKMIYAPATEPVMPQRTEDMSDAEWEALVKDFHNEHAEWEKEQAEAAAMAAKPNDPTDGPGPAEGPVVNAQNPVWENPNYFGKKGPGVN